MGPPSQTTTWSFIGSLPGRPGGLSTPREQARAPGEQPTQHSLSASTFLALPECTHTHAPGLSPPFHQPRPPQPLFSASFSHSLSQADLSRGSLRRDSHSHSPWRHLHHPALPSHPSPSHTLPATAPGGTLPPSLHQDRWPVPAGAVRHWTPPPHPRPWAPRPMPLFCISWQDYPRDYDVAAPLRGRRDGRGGSFNCDGCRPGIVTQQPRA